MLNPLPHALILVQSLFQKINRLSRSLLQVGGTTHCPNTHDPFRQRNHPYPTILEAIDADIAGVLPRTALGSSIVTKYRSALVLDVLTSQMLLGRQKRIASGRIYYV